MDLYTDRSIYSQLNSHCHVDRKFHNAFNNCIFIWAQCKGSFICKCTIIHHHGKTKLITSSITTDQMNIIEYHYLLWTRISQFNSSNHFRFKFKLHSEIVDLLSIIFPWINWGTGWLLVLESCDVLLSSLCLLHCIGPMQIPISNIPSTKSIHHHVPFNVLKFGWTGTILLLLGFGFAQLSI